MTTFGDEFFSVNHYSGVTITTLATFRSGSAMAWSRARDGMLGRNLNGAARSEPAGHTGLDSCH